MERYDHYGFCQNHTMSLSKQPQAVFDAWVEVHLDLDLGEKKQIAFLRSVIPSRSTISTHSRSLIPFRSFARLLLPF